MKKLRSAAADPAAYCRLSKGERQLGENPLPDIFAALQRFLPLGMAAFDRRLGKAMANAELRGGFHLGGFAARRAMGGELIVDVDPNRLQVRLEHRFKQNGRRLNIRDRFLGAGDWAPLLRPIARSSTHREVEEIVRAGFDYRLTASYNRALERAAGANPVKRNFVALSSPAKVEAYFRQTADLCRSIGESGMLRRSDYGPRLASLASLPVRLPWIEFGEVDIGVAVGAAGEVYRFASGKHRTAAAQALRITSMPVEIRMVHADWLARQMDETGLAPVVALRRGIQALSLTPSEAGPGAAKPA